MPHKADRSFFDSKRAWSRRKDLILRQYLAPYLAKVGTLSRPILVVDGFAGPGRFQSGEAGSPQIICDAISAYLSHRHRVEAKALCIEVDDLLFDQLEQNLRLFPFAEARHASLLEALGEIEHLARTHSVILYLDPYAIQGLEWKGLDRIFGFLQSGASVEVILNFNAFAVVRIARAATSLPVPPVDGDPVDGTTIDNASAQLVDAVVGGSWWRSVIDRQANVASEVEGVIAGVRARLGERFAEVCRHDIKEHWRHTIPKYTLLFASRHEDGLLAMNDAAAKSRLLWEAETRPHDPRLFEDRPKEVVPEESDLEQVVVDAAADWAIRKVVKVRVARGQFGLWTEKDIRGCIQRMLADGRLQSATGKTQINDQTLIRRTAEPPGP